MKIWRDGKGGLFTLQSKRLHPALRSQFSLRPQALVPVTPQPPPHPAHASSSLLFSLRLSSTHSLTSSLLSPKVPSSSHEGNLNLSHPNPKWSCKTSWEPNRAEGLFRHLPLFRASCGHSRHFLLFSPGKERLQTSVSASSHLPPH